MRSIPGRFALAGVLSLAGAVAAPIAYAQGSQPASTSQESISRSASKEEVDQLRKEVAAQRQTIEELKAMVSKLVDAKTMAASGGQAQVRAVAMNPLSDGIAPAIEAPTAIAARLTPAVLLEPEPVLDPEPLAEPAMIDQAQASSGTKSGPPLNAGWNGEHFFIRSSDGDFSINPYGYVNTDYRAYNGDGAPANSFLLRQARFGFQGNYGSHFDFAILADAAATSGSVVRDVYLNVRLRPELQFQAGQFKAPFAQEVTTGDTNLDFIERGFQSMLYPSAASAYRSPGAAFHGDIAGGVMQYWVGAFNGKGYATANTTNQPEVLGRLRFYPWRRTKNNWFREFAFGGSFDRARSRGLSGDQSFNGTLPDGAYTFFPQFAINGPIQRYSGEFTYLHGPMSVRGEYVQLGMSRNNVGSEQSGGLGFLSLPTITAKAWDISATYLLTGEKRPENGTPRVNRSVYGPDTPGGHGRGWGAWEVAFRYTGIHADEPGESLLLYYTPGYVPTFNYHTDEFTAGVNWYINYWTKYVANFSVDRLMDPSTIGQIPQNFFVFEQRIQFRF